MKKIFHGLFELILIIQFLTSSKTAYFNQIMKQTKLSTLWNVLSIMKYNEGFFGFYNGFPEAYSSNCV